MLTKSPPFVFGDFQYEVINDRTIRIWCGENFEMATPIDDFERGIARAKRVIAEYRARKCEVLPIKGHAARS